MSMTRLRKDAYDMGIDTDKLKTLAPVGEGGGSPGGPISSEDITDASTVGKQVLTAADAASAREFLGIHGAAVEDATSTEDVVDQLNALLVQLRAAGVIAG